MKTCASCGLEAHHGEWWTTIQPVPMKVNGWVGDRFVPYEKHWKGVRENRTYLCGLCTAIRAANDDAEGEMSTDLQEWLRTLAEKEVAARSGISVSSGKPNNNPLPKTFSHMSVENATAAENTLNKRHGCDCRGYEDILTFRRWLAQGYVVQRGEKGAQVPMMGGRRVTLFCRHQVTERAAA